VLLALLICAAPALAEVQVPSLTGRVVDQAGILTSAQESRLTAKLKGLEDKTTIQLVVVTLPSLRGAPIEDWGLTLGRTWGIGQKGKDNGVLLIVAPNDRELRIEVGYGLEGALPDATANAIVRNVIVPRFKAGSMADGISDGVDAIIAAVTGTGESYALSRGELIQQTISNIAPFIFIGFFVIIMIVNFIRQMRRPRGSRYYRNSSGGWLAVDDDDRDSGGGFSGGGGSFGGGGSSGRW
jgi:uncharacterized protein